MQRTATTLVFALSLISAGCSQDTAPVAPAGARAPTVGPLANVGQHEDESSDSEDGDDESEDDESEEDESADGSDEDDGDDSYDSEDDDADDSCDSEDGELSDVSDEDESESSGEDSPVRTDGNTITDPVAASGSAALPPENAPFDYQLGGDYALPSGVKIVSRDRTGSAAAGAYNICYLNGLQTQPDEREMWLSAHSELLLHKNGKVVSDPEWPDEMLLDISSSAKRAALVELEAAWITECRSKGFAAIEIDNLDSYTRSGGLLTSEHAVAFVRALSDRAHAAGLAVAQKNAAELVGKKTALGTDFAVAEECAAFEECDAYTGAYGSHVLVVEYTRAAFKNACSQHPQLSIVLRDRDLVTPGQSGYVREGC